VQVAGSVLTAVLSAGSTPVTRQSTTATQTPNVAVLIDKTINPKTAVRRHTKHGRIRFFIDSRRLLPRAHGP
jgi:hypothetical protein